MLVKVCHAKKAEWDECLDSCVYAYNTSVHESTCFTPFEIMYGRKAVLPIDIEMDDRKIEDIVAVNEGDNNDAINIMTEKRIEILVAAKLNVVKAQQKQKRLYDKKHARPCGFEVDDLVLKEDKRRKKRAGGKLDSRYIGPYIITKKFSKGIFSLKLKSDPSQIVHKVGGSQLKVYIMPDEVSYT